MQTEKLALINPYDFDVCELVPQFTVQLERARKTAQHSRVGKQLRRQVWRKRLLNIDVCQGNSINKSN